MGAVHCMPRCTRSKLVLLVNCAACHARCTKGGEPTKDQTVFLVDATEPMFEDFVLNEVTCLA